MLYDYDGPQQEFQVCLERLLPNIVTKFQVFYSWLKLGMGMSLPVTDGKTIYFFSCLF